MSDKQKIYGNDEWRQGNMPEKAWEYFLRSACAEICQKLFLRLVCYYPQQNVGAKTLIIMLFRICPLSSRFSILHCNVLFSVRLLLSSVGHHILFNIKRDLAERQVAHDFTSYFNIVNVVRFSSATNLGHVPGSKKRSSIQNIVFLTPSH